MKVLMVHNRYGRYSGEEAVVDAQVRLLQDNGHDVIRFERSSAELEAMRFGSARAFFSGIYSLTARRQIHRLLAEHRPDVVHVHNLFPLISPSVLGVCRRAHVPVVMTVHNYRLVCPNALHMVRDQICGACCGGREYWCVLKNCEGSLPRSIGYALRNWVARRFGLFRRNVTLFACLTSFQRTRLIAEGFDEERVVVIPNMVPQRADVAQSQAGRYVGFIGRLSPEKGIETLMEAARATPDIPYLAAGSTARMPDLAGRVPSNLSLLGQLTPDQTHAFYDDCRFVVMPSRWYEGFPMVVTEALSCAKPVIGARLGALAELIEHGRTGFLFRPGDAGDLARTVRYLWERPYFSERMGAAGRQKALSEYTPQRHYARLLELYEKAQSLGPGGNVRAR